MQGKNAPLQQLEGQVDALPNLLHTLLLRRKILRKKNFDIKRVINVERINIKCAFAQCAAEAGSKHCALFPALKRGSVKRLLQKAFAAFKQPEECVFINEFSAGGRRFGPPNLNRAVSGFGAFKVFSLPKQRTSRINIKLRFRMNLENFARKTKTIEKMLFHLKNFKTRLRALRADASVGGVRTQIPLCRSL